MKIVFIQISTNLINKGIKPDISSRFYDAFWENKSPDGFYKPEHFWEIPLWIAEMSHTIPNDWDKQLLIFASMFNSVSNGVTYLNGLDADIIAFSCLDVNKEIVETIIKRYTGTATITVGGYVKPLIGGDISPMLYYVWFESVKQFCEFYDITYKYGLDYSLFAGYKTIPRLTLSTGCKHRCKFCTVPNEIVTTNMPGINQQVDSFQPLDFELIYLNDKTFGQAENYKLLDGLYGYIKQNINPDFKGFIIQTTCNQLIKPGFINFLKLAKVKYVELGVETCNDTILSDMKKPQTVKLIHKALTLCNAAKLDVIPNIIIGLPGETTETYKRTIEILSAYKLYSLNPNNLAVYGDSVLSSELSTSGDDSNQLVKTKSYHTDSDKIAIDGFYQAIYKLGCEIIK